MATQWEALAERLRGQIARGALTPGDQITPEAQLADEEGVSRSTVRRALQALADEGLVTSGKGKLGRRVRQPPTLLTWSLTEYESSDRRDTHQADDWNTAVTAQGLDAAQDVTVLREYPSARVADQLGVATTEPVIVRRRIRYADGRPYQISTSYIPAHIGAGTQFELPGDQSAPGGLLASVGHPQRSLTDRIRGRMPTHDEAALLDLGAGTPVIEHMRTGYEENQQPVRVMVTIIPTDRWELRYDIALTEAN